MWVVETVTSPEQEALSGCRHHSATLAARLGLEAVADDLVGVGFDPGRKAATVVAGILAGADCIDGLDILWAGATERVLGH
jgi:hypothetical protein